MKNDLLLAVTQLAAERSLPADVVLTAVQDALTMAYKRDRLSGGEDVIVTLDPETGDVAARTVRNVVEEVEDPDSEWTVEEAQKVMPDAKVGDQITTGHIDANPGRIAAQTAKQLVMQRLRDAERELVYDEFVGKEGEVLTASVQRIDSRFVTLDLGRAEAIMPPAEQVMTERYRPGMRLKVYVSEVRRSVRGPEIIASRTHNELLRRLFETEVPEIFNGIVELRSIAREAGARSKVAVHSNQEGVDPVGACVGLRGIRIQNVVNELMGEKIDVIEWNSDPVKFIANSLSPAQVDDVRLNHDDQTAEVIVPDRQLSLAIGREGQNARLAAKLTGWHIDIKSSTAIALQPTPVAETDEAAAAAEKPAEAEVKVAVEEAVAATSDVVEEAAPAVVEAPAAAAEVEEAAPAVEEVPAVVEERPAEEETGISAEEELALLALEEELKALEEREKAEAEVRERELVASAAAIDDSDIWQVGDLPGDEGEGGIRFAEDIIDYRDMSSGRRSRRGRGASTLSPKARRAEARKAKTPSPSGPSKDS